MSLTTTLTMADEPKVSAIVQESFQKDYPNAEYVRWSKNGDYYVANFNNDMQRISVYYDENGKIYSITRFIKAESVPLNALKAVEGAIKDLEILALTSIFEDHIQVGRMKDAAAKARAEAKSSRSRR